MMGWAWSSHSNSGPPSGLNLSSGGRRDGVCRTGLGFIPRSGSCPLFSATSPCFTRLACNVSSASGSEHTPISTKQTAGKFIPLPTHSGRTKPRPFLCFESRRSQRNLRHEKEQCHVVCSRAQHQEMTLYELSRGHKHTCP